MACITAYPGNLRKFMPLTSQELQSKLWQAADILRGQIDSSDYRTTSSRCCS